MKVKPASRHSYHFTRIDRVRSEGLRVIAIACTLFFTANPSIMASGSYTDKQLDALEARVGKTYWLDPRNGKPPPFLSAPAPNATTLSRAQSESFEITELAGRATRDPYYKVKFESGKIGYIQPEKFHEGFNLTIVSADPLADEKRKAEVQSSEEKKRVEWIQAQPWSASVKDAAIKKQPPPGLNTAEVKQVLGQPRRITKVHGPLRIAEEQWVYPDGSVLIFNNGLLSRIEKTKS
jgi:hypothetical protein